MNEENVSIKTEIIMGVCADWIALARLNEADELVCKTICPKAYALDDFEDPIPETIKTTLETYKKQFYTVEVWTSEKDPDPFLVGYNPNWYVPSYEKGKNKAYAGKTITMQEKDSLGITSGWKTDATKYLLARWGKELIAFEELRIKARNLFVRKEKFELTKNKLEIENKLALLDMDADVKFGIAL